MGLLSTAEFAEIQDSYDQNRFLDAYEQTRELWQDADLVQKLDSRELILGGRLAGRLGGRKVSRWLFREAKKLAPDDPSVRYFSRFHEDQRFHLLRTLEGLQKAEPFEPGVPDLEASWLISDAGYWAFARDIDRANALADQALKLNAERAWVKASHARILLQLDRWDEALEAAEAAWEYSPGMPAAANALSSTLLRVGRTDEAAERLYAFAHSSQSHEVLIEAIWCCCVCAEACYPDGMDMWTQRAQELLPRVTELTPLRDNQMERQIQWLTLDVSFVSDDRDKIRELAPKLSSRYAKRVLNSKADGASKVVPFKPIRQKHNTCLPTSIASVLHGQGHQIDSDALARELTYGGTSTWQAADWLEENGFAVRHATLTPELAKKLLKNDLALVFMTVYDRNGHAMALVGFDECTDTLLVHDPSGSRWARYFCDSIADTDLPIGPSVLVIVPDAEAERLDVIPRDVHEPASWLNSYWKDRMQHGCQKAEVWVEKLESTYPGMALTRYVRADHCVGLGQTAQAQELLTKLAEEFPESVPVRRLLFSCLHQTGNLALLRRALERIVKEKRLPGLELKNEWRYAPPTYVSQYYDIISLSAEHVGHARKELWRTLQRCPMHAEAYHVYGDVCFRDQDLESSLLPYRVASQLEEDNDHYARAYCDVLRSLGREDDGIAFLRSRAERNSQNKRGAAAWTTLVDAYEDYGYPDAARELLEEVLRDHSDHEQVVQYAVHFWMRMGEWEKAGASLDALKETGYRGAYLSTLCVFEEQRGQWQVALEHCADWLKDAPFSMNARWMLLDLTAKKEGNANALRLLESWLEEHPGNEEFEGMLLEWLKRVHDSDRSQKLLRERVKRNPDDAWAWRELGHSVMDEVEMAADKDHESLERDLDEILEACRRTSPDAPGTLYLLARREEHNGNLEAAIDLFFRGLEQQQDNTYVYEQIARSAAKLPPEEQAACMNRLEEMLLNCVGALHGARQLAFLIARRSGIGAAQEALMRWQERRQNDPELIEAEADLLLRFGEGVSDAEKAIAILQEGIRRFPSHRDLRTSLAQAYSVALKEEEEREVWEELLRHSPKDNYARNRATQLLLRHGEVEKAEKLLEEAIRLDPLDSIARQHFAELLWNSSRPVESIKALKDALGFMPENIGLREALIDCLLNMGAESEAVQVARTGVELFDDGAYCWYILGSTMVRANSWTDHAAVEAAWRKALELNAGLFEAADDLANFLTRRHQFEEARAVMERQMELQPDPVTAKGRLAWIDRKEGKKEEAKKALLKALQDCPRYDFGWRVLMDWFDEDEDADGILEALTSWPAALVDMEELRARRLVLLDCAGFDESKLNEEWTKLLADFPQSHDIHLRRYDILWDQKRHDEAILVLDACMKYHQHSPFVLARRVQMLCHQEQWQTALETAGRVWMSPDTESSWPSLASWNSMQEAGWDHEATEFIMKLLQDDYRVQLPAFEAMTQSLARSHRPSWRDTCRLHNVFLSESAKKLVEFLEVLNEVTWDASAHRAEVISALDDINCKGYIKRLWAENESNWALQTPVWQQVGHSLLGKNRNEARRFLSNWHEKPGVEMFIVANYTIACRKRISPHSSRGDDLERIFEASKRALETLRHDGTTRFLVSNLCEAALRLEWYDEFVSAMDTYRSYIDLPEEEEENFFMRGDYRFMPELLLIFEGLLRKEKMDAQELRRLEGVLHELKAGVGDLWPNWATRQWYRCKRLIRPELIGFWDPISSWVG